MNVSRMGYAVNVHLDIEVVGDYGDPKKVVAIRVDVNGIGSEAKFTVGDFDALGKMLGGAIQGALAEKGIR